VRLIFLEVPQGARDDVHALSISGVLPEFDMLNLLDATLARAVASNFSELLERDDFDLNHLGWRHGAPPPGGEATHEPQVTTPGRLRRKRSSQ
jgi:hypothetical protein